ncbi:MAG TPA: aromatic acid exporter family protein [Actinomycetes bacterium]
MRRWISRRGDGPSAEVERARRRVSDQARWLQRLAVLRARRIGRPSWSSYSGRGAPLAWRAVKTTVAAVLSYELARRFLTDPIPLLAALTAVLVAQITIFETVRSGIERIGSVVAGVLVAGLLSRFVGLTWWGLGIVIFAALVIGQLLRLGPQSLEVPISAMLVLAVTEQTGQAAITRVVETLIGAATGVAVNALLGPSVYVQPAGNAIGELAEDLADLLRTMGEELTEHWSSEQARAWVRRTQELDAPLRAAEAALARGEESLRLNPRGRRLVEATPSLRAGLAALEHAAVDVRAICRDLADLAEAIEERGQPEPEILTALGRLLVELGEGVGAFGELVAPDVAGPPRDVVPMRIALEIARTHRDVLAELMLVDARDDRDLWHIQGSLLADVDRLLRELDVERGPEAQRVRRR